MLYGWKENSMRTNCVAACAHLTITVSEIQRDIFEKIVILSYPLHSTPPLGGFPSEHRHPLWDEKTRMVSLPDGKKTLGTLNVVWIEIKFDAYKLSRCVCPCILTITVSELQRNICKKSAFYHTPCIRRPRWGGFRRNIGTPFGTEN